VPIAMEEKLRFAIREGGRTVGAGVVATRFHHRVCLFGNFVGGLQSVFGGKLSVYVELAETARQEAFDHMCEHAAQGGANAIIGMRYDANEIMDGITEVLAYGTAVWVEPA
jgi:uncharacterized protein YbjQ (UPF0145 family)